MKNSEVRKNEIFENENFQKCCCQYYYDVRKYEKMKMEERDEMIREHMEIRQARKSAEKQIDKKDENRKSDIEIGLEILSNFLEFSTR